MVFATEEFMLLSRALSSYANTMRDREMDSPTDQIAAGYRSEIQAALRLKRRIFVREEPAAHPLSVFTPADDVPPAA